MIDAILKKQWENAVPHLEDVLACMEEKSIISVGVVPYGRIIPALFLKNYYVYCVYDVSDLDVLQEEAKIYSLGQKNPNIAKRVQSTNYLIRHNVFKKYLQSRKYPYRLMFNVTNDKLIEQLEEYDVEWIGNHSDTFNEVGFKAGFRDLIASKGLPHLEYRRFPRAEYLSKSFADITAIWNRAVAVQRADKNVPGGDNSYFLHTEADWKRAKDELTADTDFETVQLTPFVTGQSAMMSGCVTKQGILTSMLQLELVDIPELQGEKGARGSYLGHDWSVKPWTDAVEDQARAVTEAVGQHLASKGYHGIFGVDFIYDENTEEIFPLECNPRYVGAFPVSSMMTMKYHGVPPMDFFHIMTQLNIDIPFNFDYVNAKYKERHPVAHFSFHPMGVHEFKLPLRAGVYTYNAETRQLTFVREKGLLTDIEDPENEFLLIDSVPRFGTPIQQDVQRIFQVIFNKPVAEKSYKLKPEIAQFAVQLSAALRKDQVAPAATTKKR